MMQALPKTVKILDPDAGPIPPMAPPSIETQNDQQIGGNIVICTGTGPQTLANAVDLTALQIHTIKTIPKQE